MRFVSAWPHLVSHTSSWLNTFGCGFGSMSVCGDRTNVFAKRTRVFAKRTCVFTKRMHPMRENGHVWFSETDVCGTHGHGCGHFILTHSDADADVPCRA